MSKQPMLNDHPSVSLLCGGYITFLPGGRLAAVKNGNRYDLICEGGVYTLRHWPSGQVAWQKMNQRNWEHFKVMLLEAYRNNLVPRYLLDDFYANADLIWAARVGKNGIVAPLQFGEDHTNRPRFPRNKEEIPTMQAPMQRRSSRQRPQPLIDRLALKLIRDFNLSHSSELTAMVNGQEAMDEAPQESLWTAIPYMVPQLTMEELAMIVKDYTIWPDDAFAKHLRHVGAKYESITAEKLLFDMAIVAIVQRMSAILYSRK